MGIDVAAVMDTLRIMAVERHAAGPDRRGEQFNRSFLRSVRRHGRVWELGMLTAYKLRSRELFTDVEKVPRMLVKGKLKLLPRGRGGVREIEQVFRRAEEEDEKR
jgi:heterodisulfide reductase subunit C